MSKFNIYRDAYTKAKKYGKQSTDMRRTEANRKIAAYKRRAYFAVVDTLLTEIAYS